MNIITRAIESKKGRKDHGMAAMIYIMLFTLICTILGIALDASMGNYTANGLKNAIDSATLSASARTQFKGSSQAINAARAKVTFEQQYGNMRKAYPNVTSKGKYTNLKFKVSKSRGSAVNNTLTVSLTEKSSVRLMALTGVKEMKYNLKSTARLGALYEKK